MKVMCINNINGAHGSAQVLLKEGNIYTVSQCPVYKENYDVLEAPVSPINGRPVSFGKFRFIPLSDIDELELVNKKELAI